MHCVETEPSEGFYTLKLKEQYIKNTVNDIEKSGEKPVSFFSLMHGESTKAQQKVCCCQVWIPFLFCCFKSPRPCGKLNEGFSLH
jgi:hypothetical protein